MCVYRQIHRCILHIYFCVYILHIYLNIYIFSAFNGYSKDKNRNFQKYILYLLEQVCDKATTSQ